MARLTRLAVPGELHLVLQRGHNRQPVFIDDDDRAAYLAALRDAAHEHRLAIHSYALLPGEVWVLATPADGQSLSTTLQATGRRYVSGFNRRHQRSGTLWEGRFRASVIESERFFLLATCWVELQPVLQALTSDAGEWAWSSAAHHLGRRRDPLITEHPRFWELGNTPFDREARYRALLGEGVALPAQQQLLHATTRGLALGGDLFLQRMAETAARPVVARPRGRPRKVLRCVPN